MLEFDSANSAYSYAFYASAMVVFATGVLFWNPYLVALSAALLLASSVYMHSGHMMNSFLLRRGSVIEICNGYRLSEIPEAAVKSVGGRHFAVSCMTLNPTGDDRNGERLESLIYNTDFPFEFSVGLRKLDNSKVLDSLEEKRRLKEIEIARSDTRKYDRVTQLRRERGTLESEIRGIRSELLLSRAFRLRTFAESASAFGAAREAAANADRLASSFSATMGFECEKLSGEPLLEELEADRGVA
ncbi:MAG: hypothetical protein M1286_00090 [Candidatus Marsarchaeota archaeon]|nr:hypothetical protein [Candidatus Marsarchaeota archaeon]